MAGRDESPPPLTEADLARHSLQIRRFLSGILRPDELDDATQTVLQRALENIERFRGDSSPRVWLLGIARNVGFEVARARQREVSRVSWRSSKAEGEEAHEGLPHDGPSQEESLARKEQQALALEALQDLSLDDKLALLVTYVDGLPGPEAAQILGVSFAAFRQRLSRARSSLRRRLEEKLAHGEPGNAQVMRQWRALLDPAAHAREGEVGENPRAPAGPSADSGE